MKRNLALFIVMLFIICILMGCSAWTKNSDTNNRTELQSGTGNTLEIESSGESAIIPIMDRSNSPEVEKPYTIMVYIIGSNLESECGAATSDIYEMMDSGLDTDNANIVLYTGGALSWSANISNSFNSVYLLTDTGFAKVAATETCENMGDPATLCDFINYTYANYPAEKYGLICWDHGSGPVLGYGMDELYGGDGLTLEETVTAMEASPFHDDNKLDFIGYDACLMASLEIASVWSDYAEYLIASAEVESGDGWNYSFLSTLNRTDDTLELAESIIRSYSSYYDTVNSLYGALDVSGQIDATLSCVDLSKIPAVLTAFESLATKMSDGVENGQYSAIARVRSSVKSYAQSNSNAYDLVDLGDLAVGMTSLFKNESENLMDALSKAIPLINTNVEDCCGLSVYFPYYDTAGIFDNSNIYYLGCSNTYMKEYCSSEYAEFLNAFSIQRFGGAGTRSALLGVPESNSHEITMELSEEQLENLSRATYTILEETEDGVYTPVKQNCVVTPDASGVIRIDGDQSLVCVSNGWEQMVVSVEATDASHFASIKTAAFSGIFNIGAGTAMHQDVTMNFFMEDNASTLTLESINIVADDVFEEAKSALKIEDWDSLAMRYQRYRPDYDDNGEMVSYTDWNDDGWYMIRYIGMDDALQFEYIPASQLEGNYVCQVVLEDVYGGIYASELFDISSAGSAETVVCATEAGELTFSVYDGNASLVSYTGQDVEVVIPETIEGAVVTEILSGAFTYDWESKLETVILPDTVKYIQGSAFNYCDTLKEVALPAELIHIEAGAFYDCRAMERLTLSSENDYYMVVDDVLFTKDGKRLVAYPAGKAGAYRVPDGVEHIGAYSFCGSRFLSEIVLPEGLVAIGNYAFYNCAGFSSLDLPESVQVIGQWAFGVTMDWMFFNDLLPESAKYLAEIDSIYIGENVSSIGCGAFSGIANTAFKVHEDNRYFSTVDGLLTNAAGDSLVAVPMGLSGRIELPEQITAILQGAFPLGANSEIAELVIPESVVYIQSEAIRYRDDDFVVICASGTAAEAYADENNINHKDG